MVNNKEVKMEQWLSTHWSWSGFVATWLSIQTILKGLQDAEDAEPPDLKDKPIGKMAYYMQAIANYAFLGNRIKPIK